MRKERPPSTEEPAIEFKQYESPIGPIEVRSRTFLPAEDDGSPEAVRNRGVLFVPGYGVAADFAQIEELTQSFADAAKAPAYAASTWVEKAAGENAIEEQAKALLRFVEESGLKEVTIAGMSEGADKSIDLVTLLQDNHPEVKVDGLILMSAMGLYEQDSRKVWGKFFRDSNRTTWGAIRHTLRTMDLSFAKKAARSGLELAQAAWQARADISERTKADFEAMSKANPNIGKVRVPVVLVQGSEDLVSQADSIVPDKSISPQERGEYLRENLFTGSPRVEMILAEKQAYHGLPLFRGESVANASLYMLERFKRKPKVEGGN